MNLYLNRARQRLVLGLNNPSDLPGPVEVKRGDSAAFACLVCDDFGPAVELDPAGVPEITDFRLTAKVPAALGADSFIISALAYAKTGTGSSTVYTLAPSLNVIALNDLFIPGGVKATPADEAGRYALTGLAVGETVRQGDVQDYYTVIDASQLGSTAGWSMEEARERYVDLAAEVEYILGGSQVSYPTFTLRVWDDVSKGNESAPDTLAPAPQMLWRPSLTGFTGGAGKLDGIGISALEPGVMVLMLDPGTGALGAWVLTAPVAITGNTAANPTVVTAPAHGLAAGTTDILIGGSNSTPAIDGARTATYVDADTFTVPVSVTAAGTTGYFGPAEAAPAGVVQPDTAASGRHWIRRL